MAAFRAEYERWLAEQPKSDRRSGGLDRGVGSMGGDRDRLPSTDREKAFPMYPVGVACF
jgi:hypothetical protein